MEQMEFFKARPLIDQAHSIYKRCTESSISKELGKLHLQKTLCALQSIEPLSALENAQKALKFEKHLHESLGYSSSQLAVAHNTLGMAYLVNRQWDSAVEELTTSKRIREGLPNHTKDKSFSPMYYLALVHYGRGDYAKAESTILQCIEDRRVKNVHLRQVRARPIPPTSR